VLFRSKMSLKFFLFSLASLFLMLLVVVVPSLGGAINSWRSYSIALFFLAPLCIVGVEGVVATVSGWLSANRGWALKLTSAALIVLLVPYFLFSYGFFYEITEHPANYALLPTQNLNGQGVEYSYTTTWSYMIQGPVPTESVDASTWLSGSMGHSYIYADWMRVPELAAYGHISPVSMIAFSNSTVGRVLSNAYIYLGPANVQQQSILLGSTRDTNISSVHKVATASRIYSSGLVEIYRTQ